MAPTISLSQLTYTSSGLLTNPPNRLDGRDLLQFRPIEIITGIAEQSAGSALCKLGDQTSCSVVVSSEIVQEDYFSSSSKEGGRKFIECFIDVHQSIPQSVNLSTLLINLQKSFDHIFNTNQQSHQSNENTFDQSQLIILRNPKAPHHPTRAWKLIVDITLLNVSGGNIADVIFATTFSALRDVRLPKTNAIGYDVNAMGSGMNEVGQDGESLQKVDIFDVRGSLNRTSGTGRQSDKVTTTIGNDKSDESQSNTLSSKQREKIGVDFEIKDSGNELIGLEGINSFPIGITLNILPNSILLDATQTEEACLPFTRRVFVLYNAIADQIVGMQMLTASFETGSNRLGEERIPSKDLIQEQSLLGTCDFSTIKNAIQEGQKYAKGLHSAIEAQLNIEKRKSSSNDTRMEVS